MYVGAEIMELALIEKHITRNYNIEPIMATEKTSQGSGNTFYIDTQSEKYVAKFNERLDFTLIYDKIEPILTGLSCFQAKIIRTAKNELMTPQNVVLNSFLHGEVYETLTIPQIKNAVRYLRRFNSYLAKIPFIPSEIKELNNWDKAKSLDCLINEFDYRYFSIEQSNITLIAKSIKILENNMDTLLAAPKQLIHSDLGPDNFIFKNDDVYSIIDFTPEYENELYSLCQFCYWNCCGPSIEGEQLTNELLKIYYQRDVLNAEKECFNMFMVKSALFRVAGP